MKEKIFDSLKERFMFYFADDSSFFNWHKRMNEIANTAYLKDYQNVPDLKRASNLGRLAATIFGADYIEDDKLATMSSREIENLLGELAEEKEKVIRLLYGLNESNMCYSYSYVSEKVLLKPYKEELIKAMEAKALRQLKTFHKNYCELEKLELSKYAKLALKLAGIKTMTQFLEITVDTMENGYHNGKCCFGPKAIDEITAKRKELGVPLS